MSAGPASGRAFGIALSVDFPFPGLPAAEEAADAVPVALASRRELVRRWATGSERLASHPGPRGRAVLTWDWHPEHGHLLRAVGYGTFAVGALGEVVSCAPVRVPTWRWQRYLVGQVLPLLALVHGYEVFHASVVQGNGHAVAILGASGAGKSSLAAALVLRGARYVADDVLAVRPEDGLRAQPGPALTSLRRDALDRLGPGELERLGAPIGGDEHEVRLLVDASTTPAPLTGVYVLARDSAARGTTISTLRPLDPRILLSASYNFVVQDAERLERQLDVCARLANGVAVHRVTIGGDVGPGASAATLATHADLP